MKRFKRLINKNPDISRFIIIMFLLSLSVFVDVLSTKINIPELVDYDVFLSDLEEGNIDTIYYHGSSEMMRYTLFNDDTRNMTTKEREKYSYRKDEWRMTYYPSGEGWRLSMLEAGINLKVKSFQPVSLTYAPMFVVLIPFLILTLIVSLHLNKLSVKSVKIKDLIHKPETKFSDVIGHEEIIKDLDFIVDILRGKFKDNKINVRVPHGILFTGEPGTGKTLLAKAIAGESNVKLIYMNASSFVEIYVGNGARKVREMFKLARDNAPCIIFIDEIDAVGQTRGDMRGNSERDQTLNAILQEMDGFSDREDLFIIGATNRVECLDKALIRSGRFDRQVVVPPPRDWKVRKQMFEYYLKDSPMSEDIDSSLEIISKQTVGFTGSDINAVVNEAKIIAMMKSSSFISKEHIEEAIDKIIFKGNRNNSDDFDNDKKVIAYHEAGHAVMSYLCGETIARASIIGTQSGVGGAVFRTEGSSKFKTSKDLENDICIAYAGRCAEKLKFGTITTGAQNDITYATSIILDYIEKYGFNNKFGMIDMDILHNKNLIDSSYIIQLVSEMAVRYEELSINILKDNFDKVNILAEELLLRETISDSAIKELFDSMNIRKEVQYEKSNN